MRLDACGASWCWAVLFGVTRWCIIVIQGSLQVEIGRGGLGRLKGGVVKDVVLLYDARVM